MLTNADNAIANDASHKGQLASTVEIFGEFSRYAIFAIHTRFDAVEWIVTDAEIEDEVTGKPTIIRQEALKADALCALN